MGSLAATDRRRYVLKKKILKYIKTNLGIGPSAGEKLWKKRFIKFLSHIIPKANPDFEHLYQNVRMWWLEIEAKNIPQRELGFDEKGNVIVAAPISNNYGFWTDGGGQIESENMTLISRDEFVKAWDSFESEHYNQGVGT